MVASDETEVTLQPPGRGETLVAPFLAARDRLTAKAEGSSRHRWWVLWTILGGLFAVNVAFTIIVVALPRIANELGTSRNTLTWVLTGPLLALGVVAPAMGKAGDLWGHRRLYLISILGVGSCALLSALAWNAGSLIAFRTLSAIEGAATGSSSLAIIFSVFHAEDRVKAMGWWSLVGAGGPVIGVAIGGPIIEAFGWRWVFAAQAPLILIAFMLASAILPETPRKAVRRFDYVGAVTLVFAVLGVLFALNRGPEWGWTSPVVLAAFAVTPLGIALFLWAERRAEDPLLPLHYLRRRNFSLPIGASAFGNFAYMGGFYLAPALLQHPRLFGYGESRTGLMVLVRPLTFSLIAPMSGYLAVRFGERIAAVVGIFAVTCSMAVFTTVDGASTDLLILLALGLSGLGLGMAMPSISASVANSVEQTDLGIASASQQLVVQVATVAGVQLMTTVQATLAPEGLASSFQRAYLLGGVVSLLGVACAFGIRRAQRERVEGAPEGALETA